MHELSNVLACSPHMTSFWQRCLSTSSSHSPCSLTGYGYTSFSAFSCCVSFYCRAGRTVLWQMQPMRKCPFPSLWLMSLNTWGMELPLCHS